MSYLVSNDISLRPKRHRIRSKGPRQSGNPAFLPLTAGPLAPAGQSAVNDRADTSSLVF